MAELVSPNVLNYAVFKGEVYFTPTGGARRHMGNATVFSMEPTVTKLDHFSSMTGIRSKDKTVVTEKSFTLSITLEEMTLSNFKIALLGGDIGADSVNTTEGGLQGFEIGAETSTNGVIEFFGTNEVGPQYDMRLYSVELSPDGAVEFIGDNDWANVALTGDVLAVNGSFGRYNLKNSADSTTA